jgi:hypothetical protein
MKCKVDRCNQQGRHCGMCGKESCAAHGHIVQADDNLGMKHEDWICNDCAAELVAKVKSYLS